MFSIIYPGMGLIYYSKWLLGIFFILVHLSLGFWLLASLIIDYNPHELSYTIATIQLPIVLLVVNWLLSLILTHVVDPNE